MLTWIYGNLKPAWYAARAVRALKRQMALIRNLRIMKWSKGRITTQ